MHFASPLPWWLALGVAAAIAGIAYLSYRRPLIPLSSGRRWLLTVIRGLTLGVLVLLVCRPLVLLPPATRGELMVPILVDGSKSMRIADADGVPRIDRARELLKRELLPALSARFRTEVYAFGETVSAADVDHLNADALRTDLVGALQTIRDRYRGRRVPGIVVLSDGGDTEAATSATGDGPPVVAIGLGSASGVRDREVLSMAAGNPGLDQSVVDLRVSVVSHGFGRAPFALRLLGNGAVLDTRRIVPVADGSPEEVVFTVIPDPLAPTVYRAEIAADAAEPIVENNARSLSVGPAGRTRRVLVVEGAPGFDHSFLRRALAGDPGLDVDAVTRKGRNDTGERTFFVQAGGGRAAGLTGGFPATREALFGYDLLMLANVEADEFTQGQLAMAADFVSVRGGGLLVLGSRSFAQHGLSGTALEDLLPVELGDRRGGAPTAAAAGSTAVPLHAMALTTEGENHPVMRLGATPEETRKRWAAVPALASSAPLGAPRAGASVLAVTPTPGGVVPVVAVQRFGRGRSMVFGGEASWRWRMLAPSSDRTYEHFWRQAVRWLAVPSPDPVTVAVPDGVEPGDRIDLGVDVRDGRFVPATDAAVDVTVTFPGGEVHPTSVRRAPSGDSTVVASIAVDRPGMYRIQAAARRGTAPLGTADRWFLVGGQEREFADPRLNVSLLERLAQATGGRYAGARDAVHALAALTTVAPQTLSAERRDLWHEPWVFALVLLLLASEWVLRRRWGLR